MPSCPFISFEPQQHPHQVSHGNGAHGPCKKSRPLLHRKLNIQFYKSGSLPKVVRKRERLDIWTLYLPSYFSPIVSPLGGSKSRHSPLALTFRIFFYETFPLLNGSTSSFYLNWIFFFVSTDWMMLMCDSLVVNPQAQVPRVGAPSNYFWTQQVTVTTRSYIFLQQHEQASVICAQETQKTSNPFIFQFNPK